MWLKTVYFLINKLNDRVNIIINSECQNKSSLKRKTVGVSFCQCVIHDVILIQYRVLLIDQILQ